MEVRIKYGLLSPIADFLFGMTLKGKQSRHRTRFIKKLENKLKEVQLEEREIRKQHCNLDESGEPKTIKVSDEQFVLDVKDIEAFTKDQSELYGEEYVIDDSDSQIVLETLKTILDEYHEALSGEKANVYDYLCDQFEID